MLDLYVWTVIASFIVGILNASFGWSLLDFGGMTASSQDALAGLILVPVALICDVLVYATFGNTIGKALLGVKVLTLNGAQLPAGLYAARTFQVWIFGLGLGIPIIALFTEISGYRTVSKGERTRWDIKYSCRVSRSPRRVGHYFIAVLIFLAFFAALVYGKMLEQNEMRAQTAALNQPPVSWQNPFNQQSVVILPAGWHLLPANSKLPPNTYLYADATNTTVIGIGYEATDMTLDEYTDAILRGNPTLAVIRNGSVITDGSKQVWTGSGSGVPTGSTDAITARAHVFGGAGGYWRVFAAAPQGRPDVSEQEADVYRAVSRTTAP
jgi:hypothetical protein